MKNLKKNQFIIYAISLMLVAAGYFNYITYDKNVKETYSEDIQSENLEQTANVGDAVLVNNKEIINEDTNMSNENKSEVENNSNIRPQNNSDVAEEREDSEGNKDNYFVSSKLERDKMYANMISNYEAILNNNNCTETQKNIATQEITKINNTKNAIMISENLLSTKGFNNCVVLANEESINVIVGTKEKLQQDKVAIIQNIISRELKEEIKNIHITEK